MAKSIFVYVTYIRTTPEKLQSALTDVELMEQYWFGVHCVSRGRRDLRGSWCTPVAASPTVATSSRPSHHGGE